MMSDTIRRIEEEIRKLEDRLRAMETEKPGSPQDRKVHAATHALLRNVINDLRRQQRKLQAQESSEE